MMAASANNIQPVLQAKSGTDLVVIRDFYRPEKKYGFQVNFQTRTYSVEPYGGNDHTHGVGVQNAALNAGVTTAYFSCDHVEDKSGPRFELSMFFATNGEIFCLSDGSSKFIWRVGFFNRSLRIRRPLKDDFVYSYAWPFYRQLLARVFGDPFNFTPNDFFEQFSEVAKFYYPDSFATK